jgi:hypothetical protein
MIFCFELQFNFLSLYDKCGGIHNFLNINLKTA